MRPRREYPDPVKRPLIIVAIVLAVGLLAAAVYAAVSSDADTQIDESPSPSATAVSDQPSATPSASPSTPSPSPSVTASTTSEPPNVPTIPGAAAVVTLATWQSEPDVLLVGGFVSGVIEDGGVCKFTVSASDTGAVSSVEATGVVNVDSTSCGSHEVAAPTSQSGEFSVTMSYTNEVGTVSSSPRQVD